MKSGLDKRKIIETAAKMADEKGIANVTNTLLCNGIEAGIATTIVLVPAAVMIYIIGKKRLHGKL